MKLPIIAVTPALLATACSQSPATPITLSGATKSSQCLGIDIPVETEASVAGVYEGATPSGTPPRQPGETRPQIVRLSETVLDRPQVLILSAYESVIWDVSGIRPELVRGIVAYGYKRPAVIGAPNMVPVKRVWYGAGKEEPDGDGDCGIGHIVFRGGPALDALADDVQETMGVPVRRFVGAYSPAALDFGGPAEQGWDAQSLTLRRADTLPGAERLAPLVASGVIRLATAADIAAWNAAATATLKTGALAPYRAENLRLNETYVALQPFDVPAGMHGANARSFIIAKGVEPPADDDSHNSYYLIATGQCIGTAPECARNR